MTFPTLDRTAIVALSGVGVGLLGLLALAGEMAGRFPRGSTIAVLVLAATVAAVAVLRVLARDRANFDADTGLPTLQALIRAVQAGDATIAVARIDGLTALADTLGPVDRATLVQRVAERLRLGTGGIAVHRVGEAALAWRVDAEAAEAIDERFAGLAAVMRAPIVCGGRAIDVAITFGVAEGPARTMPALVAAALAAATRARDKRRRWERAIPDDLDASDWKASLVDELDKAIASGALWVAYQPKLDIASGRVVGCEALARWQHSRRGNIPPDLFVPLIEARGRAAALTTYVLHTALADAVSWRRIGRPIGVAVNVSATLLSGDLLVPEIAAALARHRVPPDMLTLEVTESAAIASADAAIAQLQELRDLGVKISIDDYGTGQSTMTYLKRFPATELKIDKSFVQGLADSGADMILVRSTIDLAHALGMIVVAEGVEDQPCLDRLRGLGCDVAQGWHVGRPMPAENLSLMQAWQRAA